MRCSDSSITSSGTPARERELATLDEHLDRAQRHRLAHIVEQTAQERGLLASALALADELRRRERAGHAVRVQALPARRERRVVRAVEVGATREPDGDLRDLLAAEVRDRL